MIKKQIRISDKFGSLLVLSQDNNQSILHQNKCKSTNWKCKCDCGNYCVVPQTILTRKTNTYKHCGCKPNKITNFKCYQSIISKYKSDSKIRGLKFKLTDIESLVIIQSPCYYCGLIAETLYPYKGVKVKLRYNGIDRLDSSLDYYIENTVPCCYKCNIMKNTLSYEEFIGHIFLIQQNCSIYPFLPKMEYYIISNQSH